MSKTGRRIRRWLIILLVLAVVLVVGDRVAAFAVERQIANQVADSAAERGAASEHSPEVDVHGFPFLTQVIGGEYGQVDITMRDVHADNLVFPTLELEAHNIDAPLTESLRGGDIVASTVDATGTISADSLSSLVDEVVEFDIAVSSGGELDIEATLDVFGHEVPVQGGGSIELVDNALSLTAGDFAAVDTSLPPGGEDVLQSMVDGLNTVVELPTLPYGITLTDLEFSNEAILVKGSAEDVELTL